MIYSDFHVANAMNGALTFPAECPTTDLTPQEKILEFTLFDLFSCVGGGGTTPPPPPPLPPPPAPDLWLRGTGMDHCAEVMWLWP